MIDVAVLSHAGLVRPVNEDAAACFPIGDPDAVAAGRLALVVCDGVGGRKAGSAASRLAVVRFGDLLADPWWALSPHDAHWQQEVEQRLVSMLDTLNKEIAAESRSSEQLHGMATTLSAVLLFGDWYCAVHVGDSRVFLLRGERLRQLTVDHSWAEEQRALGRLTAEQIQASPYRDQLVQVVGLGRPLAPSVSFGRLAPGDRIVVCSDGLTKHVAPEHIGLLLRNGSYAQGAGAALIDRALHGGGSDNITVAVAVVNALVGPRMQEPEAATLRLSAPRGDGREMPIHHARPKSRAFRFIGAIAVLLLIAAGGYWWSTTRQSKPRESVRPPITSKSRPAGARGTPTPSVNGTPTAAPSTPNRNLP